MGWALLSLLGIPIPILIVFLRASPAARGHLWTKLQPVLEIHEKIEDAHLYGPLSHDAGKMDSKLAAWRKRHQNEVDKVEGLMEDMAALAPEDASWLATRGAGHFPRIKKVWDEIRLKQAGTGMKAMKAKKLKPTAARRVA